MSLSSVGGFSSMPQNLQQTCFERFAEFLELEDIISCENVCTLWNKFSKDQEIWVRLSLRMGVCLVDAQERDRRADFQCLHTNPRYIGKRRIEKVFGEMAEEVPRISVAFFNKLCDQDPCQSEKSIRENYWVVVVPSTFTR